MGRLREKGADERKMATTHRTGSKWNIVKASVLSQPADQTTQNTGSDFLFPFDEHKDGNQLPALGDILTSFESTEKLTVAVESIISKPRKSKQQLAFARSRTQLQKMSKEEEDALVQPKTREEMKELRRIQLPPTKFSRRSMHVTQPINLRSDRLVDRRTLTSGKTGQYVNPKTLPCKQRLLLTERRVGSAECLRDSNKTDNDATRRSYSAGQHRGNTNDETPEGNVSLEQKLRSGASPESKPVSPKRGNFFDGGEGEASMSTEHTLLKGVNGHKRPSTRENPTPKPRKNKLAIRALMSSIRPPNDRTDENCNSGNEKNREVPKRPSMQTLINVVLQNEAERRRCSPKASERYLGYMPGKRDGFCDVTKKALQNIDVEPDERELFIKPRSSSLVREHHSKISTLSSIALHFQRMGIKNKNSGAFNSLPRQQQRQDSRNIDVNEMMRDLEKCTYLRNYKDDEADVNDVFERNDITSL